MRRVLLSAMVTLVVFSVSSVLLAGNGRGPGDGTGPRDCECGLYVDEDEDGFCDCCDGCIPKCDGTGSKGRRK